MNWIDHLRPFYAYKKIFVIGGSEGIGLATAAGAAALGADVVVLSRDPQKLAGALKRLETARQGPAQVLATASIDISDNVAAASILNGLMIRYGTPDILIHAAGYAHPGYFRDMDEPVFRQMIELNYLGCVHAVKAVLPAMIRARRGHIITMSSMAGYLGLYGYTGYCASKYAVIGFSRALRQELFPDGIAVSVLCPPNTQTPGYERENKIKPAEVLALEERAGTASAETVARALLRALPRRPFLIHPTFRSKLIYHATRLFPSLTDRFTRKPN